VDAEGRREWLLGRRGIGGSQSAQILGHSDFGGPERAYQEITNILDGHVPFEEELTIDQERGHDLEGLAAKKWEAQTGHKTRRQPQKEHPEHPFIIANVDRQIIANGTPTGILEVKCPRYHKFLSMKDDGLRQEYYIQLQHYLAVYGYTWGAFAIFHSDCGLIHFNVERHPEFIDSVLLPRLTSFWNDHIEPRKPPIVEAEEIPDLPKIEGQVKQVDSPEFASLIEDLREVYEAERGIREIKVTRQQRVKEFMENMGADVVEGSNVRVYYRPSKPRQTWDAVKVAGLIMDQGLEPSEFKKSGKASRPFKPYDRESGKPL
jgi:putative phage-type endonuclease